MKYAFLYPHCFSERLFVISNVSLNTRWPSVSFLTSQTDSKSLSATIQFAEYNSLHGSHRIVWLGACNIPRAWRRSHTYFITDLVWNVETEQQICSRVRLIVGNVNQQSRRLEVDARGQTTSSTERKRSSERPTIRSDLEEPYRKRSRR